MQNDHCSHFGVLPHDGVSLYFSVVEDLEAREVQVGMSQRKLYAVYGLDLGTSKRYRFVLRAEGPAAACAKMEAEGINVVGVRPWWQVKARRYVMRTGLVCLFAAAAVMLMMYGIGI